jgi:pimeloyl-ACP methyl ester carboxylesterase
MNNPRTAYEQALDRLMQHHTLSARRRFLDADGERPIHLLELGEGEPLVCIHGGLSFGASYAALWAGLGGRRIVAPDRPGHGLSYRVDYARVPDYRRDAADFVLRVVDALGLERVDLLGNSMGGFFSCAFALAHPERVRRLVLLGAPAGIDRWIPPMLRLLGTPGINRVLTRLMGPMDDAKLRDLHGRILMADPSRASAEYFDCGLAADTIEGHDVAVRTMLESVLTLRGWRERYYLRDAMASLAVPTLFAWGDRDAFAPPSSGRELAARMPDACFELLEDAGHLPWLDQPARTAAVVDAFLREAGQRAA